MLIVVTELGIIASFRAEQLENAYSPIFVTELGMFTLVIDKHLLKALCSIVITVFGIVMFVRVEQY